MYIFFCFLNLDEKNDMVQSNSYLDKYIFEFETRYIYLTKVLAEKYSEGYILCLDLNLKSIFGILKDLVYILCYVTQLRTHQKIASGR